MHATDIASLLGRVHYAPQEEFVKQHVTYIFVHSGISQGRQKVNHIER